MKKPRIVVVGAGYGGMMTVKQLTKRLHGEDAQITLVNKYDYHYQTTWLHQPAAGTLPYDRTRMQIKDVIDLNRVQLIQDTVTLIKPDEHKVMLESGDEVDYDYLVISLGFEAETFGIPGLGEHAYFIKDVESVRRIHQHIKDQFTHYCDHERKNRETMNIVVGGGGLTGVELIGELTNRVPELCREFNIDRKNVRLILVEGLPTILPGFDEGLVQYAIRQLESKGVEFKLETFVQECRQDSVVVKAKEGGETEEIEASVIVWAGGVRGHRIGEVSGFATDRGRIKLNTDLRVLEFANIFAIGDCSLVANPETNRPYPPNAQMAIQQAYVVARNIEHLLRGQPTETFVFDNKGTLASLGRGDAVGVIFNAIKLKGRWASAMKKIVDNRYLLKLGGVKLMLKKGRFNFFT